MTTFSTGDLPEPEDRDDLIARIRQRHPNYLRDTPDPVPAPADPNTEIAAYQEQRYAQEQRLKQAEVERQEEAERQAHAAERRSPTYLLLEEIRDVLRTLQS